MKDKVPSANYGSRAAHAIHRTMSSIRCVTSLSLLVAAQVAVASGESYEQLVGKLHGDVESPRLIRDFCATRSPDTAAANAKLYDEWRSRHSQLLADVDVQLDHAGKRVFHKSPPSDPQSYDEIRENMKAKLEETFKDKPSEWIVKFCSAYPKYMEKKDEEARTSLRQQLSKIEEADKELKSRETSAQSDVP